MNHLVKTTNSNHQLRNHWNSSVASPLTLLITPTVLLKKQLEAVKQNLTPYLGKSHYLRMAKSIVVVHSYQLNMLLLQHIVPKVTNHNLHIHIWKLKKRKENYVRRNLIICLFQATTLNIYPSQLANINGVQIQLLMLR